MIWLLLSLGIAAAVLWLSWLCYRIAFFSVNEKEKDVFAIPPGKQYEEVAQELLEMIHEANELPFDIVSTTSGDGTLLVARYYHFYDGAPVQILFHGYRGNGVREFSGNHRLAEKLGFNSIVVDGRGHGKSCGHTISFGIRERYDCLAWARFARDTFGPDTPVFLSGISMGAATVLMASQLRLPGNVVGITADCPYSSPGGIIRKVSRDMKLPPWLSYPFVVIGALVYGRFCIWKSSPVKAVAHTRIPILLIHGEDDRFVPCDMSREIFEACEGKAELVTVPEAGHALSYTTDTEKYEIAFRSFLQSCGIVCKTPDP